MDLPDPERVELEARPLRDRFLSTSAERAPPNVRRPSPGQTPHIANSREIDMKYKRYTFMGATAFLVLLIGTAAAQEVTGGFIARGTLGKVNAHNEGITVKGRGSTDVVVARFTFEPGSSSGWHHDAGVNLVVLESGKLQEFDENCDKRVLRAGEGFFEQGDTHLIRNVGNKDAVIRATFIVPTGTPTDELVLADDPPEDCDIE
jgi:quercetin dioxygenase-like cupin family protein